MKRIWKFLGHRPAQPAPTWDLSPELHQCLLERLAEIGLDIVQEQRGPVPLLTFGRRVLERLETPRPVPVPLFADALKRVIRDMRHDRLRVMAPSDFMGVGYVYNAQDPDTWPVRSSR